MSLPGSPWFDPGLPPPTYQQIMELVVRSVNDDADSRTAAVKLKRHRGEGSPRGSSRGSSKQSTPRKRAKYGNVGRQDIADFVPTGANFSASNLDTEVDHEAGLGKLNNAPKSVTQEPSNHGKSIKENPENGELRSANIRLDFPAALCPQQIPSIEVIAPGLMHTTISIAVIENSAYVQEFEKAFNKRQTLHNALTKSKEKGRERSIIQSGKDLHRAEINLAWCQYYPLNCEWRPPKVPPTPGSTYYKAFTESQKFWLVVELCFVKGTLPDLRAGIFGSFADVLSPSYEQAIANQQDIQSARERYDWCLKSLKQADSTGSTESLRKQLALAEVDVMYCIYYPKSRTYEPLDAWRQFGSDVSNTEPSLHGSAAQLWSLVRHCMCTKQLPDLKEERLGRSDENGDNLLTTPERDPRVARRRRSSSSKVKSEASDVGDCSHDAVDGDASPINSFDHDRNHVEVYDSGDDDMRMSISQNSDMFLTNIDEEDEEHSQSDSVQAVEEGRNNQNDSDAEMELMDTYPHSAQDTGRDLVTATSKEVRTLAELPPEDLNAQICYFHIPKRADEVSLSSLVRCLTCGAKGHMAPDCEMLDCTACGAFNDHITADCPLNVKCPKCRAPGHIEEACSSKLRMPREDITCDLCNCRGHLEEECELFWRTSGAPWKSKLPLGQIRVSCHECGLTGHLGNECPSRRPRKPMGTSSWSIHPTGPTPTSFGSADLNPPERATKKRKILDPSKGNPGDEGNYLVIPSNPHVRAKIPEAGKIRINVPDKPSATNAPAVNALANEKHPKSFEETKNTSNQAVATQTQPPIRWEDIPRTLGAPPQMGQWSVINAYPGAHDRSPTLLQASHSATTNEYYRHHPPLPYGPPPPLPAAVQTYQQGHQYNYTPRYGWRPA